MKREKVASVCQSVSHFPQIPGSAESEKNSLHFGVKFAIVVVSIIPDTKSQELLPGLRFKSERCLPSQSALSAAMETDGHFFVKDF